MFIQLTSALNAENTEKVYINVNKIIYMVDKGIDLHVKTKIFVEDNDDSYFNIIESMDEIISIFKYMDVKVD